MRGKKRKVRRWWPRAETALVGVDRLPARGFLWTGPRVGFARAHDGRLSRVAEAHAGDAIQGDRATAPKPQLRVVDTRRAGEPARRVRVHERFGLGGRHQER